MTPAAPDHSRPHTDTTTWLQSGLRNWLLGGVLIYMAGFFLFPSRSDHTNWAAWMVVAPTLLSCIFLRRSLAELNHRHTLTLILLILLLLLVPAILNADSILETARQRISRTFVTAAVLFSFVLLPNARKHIETTIPRLCLLAAGIATAVYISDIPGSRGWPYPTGWGILSDNPNTTALALATGSIFSFHAMRTDKSTAMKLIGGFVFISIISSIYWTRGTTAIASMGAALIFYEVLQHIRAPGRWITLGIPAIIAVTALIFYLLSWIVGPENLDFISARLHIWDVLISGFLESPILGQGFEERRALFIPALDFRLEAHSTYLDILYRSGLAGFLLIAAMVTLVLRHLTEAWSRTAQLYFVLFLFGLVFQITEGIYPVRRAHMLFICLWIPLGCMLSLSLHYRSHKDEQHTI